MKKTFCAQCKTALSTDEVALNLRLLGMQIGQFHCLDCLAGRLGTSRERLELLMKRFKEMGCAYFTRLEEDRHGQETDSSLS